MEINEKFTVNISDQHIIITGFDQTGTKQQLNFSPAQALMLLDILQHEADRIRQAADMLSPIPIKISLDNT